MKKVFKICIIYCICFMFTSCCNTKSTTVNITKETSVISKFDYTIFYCNVCTVKLSVHKIQALKDEEIDKGHSVIRGKVFHRDEKSEYSGHFFGEMDVCGPGGWPHVLIPSLKIDSILREGVFEITIPEGKKDILVYAVGYYPIHINLFWESQTIYDIEFYLGHNSLH